MATLGGTLPNRTSLSTVHRRRFLEYDGNKKERLEEVASSVSKKLKSGHPHSQRETALVEEGSDLSGHTEARTRGECVRVSLKTYRGKSFQCNLESSLGR